VQAQEMAIDVDHGKRGVVRMTGFPVKLSDTPARVRHPAPELGEHTTALLVEAGYTTAEIDALRAKKCVG
jgi:crotonobetainyl-CoA:carnitine CoA-transferase CaiB-like acyl-CoA transferase